MEPNYKIYSRDDCGNEKLICKFYAKNDIEANRYLVENYINTCTGVKGTMYWGRWSPIRVMQDDGTVHTYESHREAVLGMKSKNVFKQIKDFILDNITYYLWDKPKSLWYWAADIVFLLKNKIEQKAAWSFDYYIINEIEKVLPMLMENKHGINQKYLDDAILQLHGHEAGFSLEKYNKEHMSCYSKEDEDLAYEIMKNAYDDIILHCKLFRYYSGFGNLDSDSIDAKEFESKWRHTLPIKDGSYDEFDYEKLAKLEEKEWNTIWDMMKEHGRTMWD